MLIPDIMRKINLELPNEVFRPPSDGGLMIPQEQVGHVFVKRLVYQKVKVTFL